MASVFPMGRLLLSVCVCSLTCLGSKVPKPKLDPIQALGFGHEEGKLMSSSAIRVADIGSIKIMVVDTRQEADMYLLGKLLRVDNVGSGHSWHAWETKNCLSRDYVADIANKTPEKVVVAADGGDVLYGGCDEATLRAKYDQIISASTGNTVVVGAELGAWPQTVPDLEPLYEQFQDRMDDVMKAAGLNRSVYTQFSHGCGNCGHPPVYKFANGGFKMGPAKDLAHLFDTLCSMKGDEQANLHGLLVDGKHHLTLDYTGSLVLSLHGFDKYADILSVQSHSVHNSVTGLTQCFAHGNGEGKSAVNALAQALQAAA